ncbi:hypothetical protein J5TS1_33080 [Bacillus licheniformis]|uniref:hypothetical protein n=1 Tax=Bacillus licheniformis TaxID=1402 RepID=UPI00119F8B1F|nr:hypothetical protein [Bacillus licheniformis]MDQ9095404.1 hypothetical protein [Bacillus licheniformis]MEC0477022.1 hypothetical protein [Bacillus licheniformis]MEC0491013.1 hypothetical protein [Bacillus licheniformis]TWK93494.1 hypothetical protein CHCC20325_2018 [Bacillus licheniformis]GIN35805.1 hypothetical protein J5TS1_33080 [Bacillus licheniformis]
MTSNNSIPRIISPVQFLEKEIAKHQNLRQKLIEQSNSAQRLLSLTSKNNPTHLINKSREISSLLTSHINSISQLQANLNNMSFRNLDIQKVNLSFIDEISFDDLNDLENEECLQEVDEFIYSQHLDNDNITAEDINSSVEKTNTLRPLVKLLALAGILQVVLMVMFVQGGGEEALGNNFQDFAQTFIELIGGLAAIEKSSKKEKDSKE